MLIGLDATSCNERTCQLTLLTIPILSVLLTNILQMLWFVKRCWNLTRNQIIKIVEFFFCMFHMFLAYSPHPPPPPHTTQPPFTITSTRKLENIDVFSSTLPYIRFMFFHFLQFPVPTLFLFLVIFLLTSKRSQLTAMPCITHERTRLCACNEFGPVRPRPHYSGHLIHALS